MPQCCCAWSWPVACSEADDEDNDSPLSGTTSSTSLEGITPTANAFDTPSCEESADHVVVISNFSYAPSFINVKVGETVAWINHEACGDFAPEQLVAPYGGCDTHHEVVTFPATPGGESIDSGDLCSPNRGIAPPEGPVLIGSTPQIARTKVAATCSATRSRGRGSSTTR